MRIFQTFVLPDNLVAKHNLSFAAANFSRNLIKGGMFDKVYSLIPVNVRGDLGEIEDTGYEVVYSNWRKKGGLLGKLAIIAEQWKVLKKVSKEDSIWFYNLNFLNSFLYIFLKCFKPSVKLNVIVLDFTPPKNWKEQNYWFLKIINSADSAIYLADSELYKVKKATVIPGVVPPSEEPNPRINHPQKEFLLSGVISENIAMTSVILEAFSKNKDCVLHITGRVMENEELIKEYSNKYDNIIYHRAIPFDEYLNLLHKVTFQLSTRNPNAPENQFNFPSKIIEALLHNRIVVSTISYPQLKGIEYLCIDPNNIEQSLANISSISSEQLLKNANQEDKVRNFFGTSKWTELINELEQ